MVLVIPVDEVPREQCRIETEEENREFVGSLLPPC